MPTRSYRCFFTISAIAIIGVVSGSSWAYNIPAYDQASFSAYTGGWNTTPAPNGGHGFQAWSFYQGAGGSYIPFTSATIATNSTIGSGPSNKVWELGADATSLNGNTSVNISAGRLFDSPVQLGQSFFIDMDAATSDTSATSISLTLSSAPTDPSDFTTGKLDFGIYSDPSTGDYDFGYEANTGFLGGLAPTLTNTSIPVDDDPVHIDVHLNLDGSITGTITSISNPLITDSVTASVYNPIQFVNLSAQANAGSEITADFNRMGVTPLPPAVIAAAPLLGILAFRKRRRS
ncbi:MAG TPA: hypothetical protein VGG19_01675 [Tepidisphaeraceae bacterium]|jgi:hypothetical protein